MNLTEILRRTLRSLDISLLGQFAFNLLTHIAHTSYAVFDLVISQFLDDSDDEDSDNSMITASPNETGYSSDVSSNDPDADF